MKKIIAMTVAALCILVACGGKDGGCTGGGGSEDGKDGGCTGGGGSERQPPVEQAEAPACVRVYIDNSGSMRGYARGENGKEFGMAQMTFINAISDMKSLMEGGQAFFWPDTAHTIEGNIAKKLQENRFAGKETPFPEMLATMAREAVEEGSLDFLITDGIIGMKKSDTDVLQASLGVVKNSIRDSVAKFTLDGTSIAVMRLKSGYTTRERGYVTHRGDGVNLSCSERPFFIIAVGKRPAIQWLLDRIKSDGSLAAYSTVPTIAFGLHEQHQALYLSDRTAFEIKKGVTSLKKAKGTFSLASDIPPCLVADLGLDYMRQNLEVKLNDTRLNSLPGWRNDVNNPQKGFYVDDKNLYINWDDIRKISSKNNVVTVRLKKTLPSEWSGWSSNDDTNIANDSLEQTKTFALSYLLNGIYEATDGGQMLLDTEFKFTK